MAEYKSRYTGQQIDDAVERARTLAEVGANPTDTPTDTLDTITIGDTTYRILKPIVVEGNPEEGGEVLLRTILIGNETFFIPQPIEVEANPVGGGGELLTSLQVGEESYDIPQPITIVPNPVTSGTETLIKITVGATTYIIPQAINIQANVEDDYTANLTSLRIGDETYLIPVYSRVSGNDAEDASTPLTNITINGTEYYIPQAPEVEANPVGGGGELLTALRVGEESYDIPQPITIVPNPTTEGTVALTKLRIGATTYNIPQPTGTANRTLFIASTPYMSQFTMTWAEWVANTVYNTDGYRVLDEYIAPQGDDTKVVMLGDVAVLPTDSVATKNYVLGDKPISTVTIPSGVYVGNDTIWPIQVFDTTLNFVSNGITFVRMSYTSSDTMYFYNSDGVSTYVYGPDDEGIYVWQNTAYKTITIATDQEVAPEFAEWFNENYTKQTGKIELTGASSGTLIIPDYWVGNPWGDYVMRTIDTWEITKYNNYIKLMSAYWSGYLQLNGNDVTTTDTVQATTYTCEIEN